MRRIDRERALYRSFTHRDWAGVAGQLRNDVASALHYARFFRVEGNWGAARACVLNARVAVRRLRRLP